MKNIDKIRAMSAEELGAFLGKAINQCSLCNYQDIPECSGNCEKGITRWLNAKFEKPMPELEVGDIVETRHYALVFVGINPIGDKIVVRSATKERMVLSDVREVERIWHFSSKGEYETIWRADNGN